jgi:hypothetical protein
MKLSEAVKLVNWMIYIIKTHQGNSFQFNEGNEQLLSFNLTSWVRSYLINEKVMTYWIDAQ